MTLKKELSTIIEKMLLLMYLMSKKAFENEVLNILGRKVKAEANNF